MSDTDDAPSNEPTNEATNGPPTLPPGVLAVRVGPGANCSSVGSVIDLLFGAVVVSGVLYAAIHAAVAERRAAEKPDAKGEDER